VCCVFCFFFFYGARAPRVLPLSPTRPSSDLCPFTPGVPPPPPSAGVLVTVLVVNDNLPIFGGGEYVTSVRENPPSGEGFARVCVFVGGGGSV